MQLSWTSHSAQLIDGISEILGSKELLDVTLTAEGKQIRAHKVILSAASTYFRDILTSSDVENHPIIFMRDVSFHELESLIQFIYSGQTTINNSNLDDFLKLGRTLGVKGFDFCNNKENLGKVSDQGILLSPFKKSCASEPANMPSHLLEQFSNEQSRDQTISCDDNDASLVEGGSAKKKRRLQSKSLNDIISPPQIFKTPNCIKSRSPATPMSPLVLPPFWSTVPPVMSPLSGSPPKCRIPIRQQSCVHASHLSCPIDNLSPNHRRATNNASNFSFDSGTPFPDPNELAAKGATLLHHLALWMIEEKKLKDQEEEVRRKSETTPRNLQQQPSTSQAPSMQPVVGHRHRGSECDRPDSGFDSKDEDESKNNISVAQVSEAISEETVKGSGVTRSSSEASTSSSPDILTEISRQALIRQPIIRKRRLNIH